MHLKKHHNIFKEKLKQNFCKIVFKNLQTFNLKNTKKNFYLF